MNIIRIAVCALCIVSSLQPLSAASRPAVRARHGMIVSAQPLATAAGVDVLRRGGNAVDAAVAVGFALGVAYPQAGNIGGGGFMVIRMADGRTTTIDYREEAPGRATRDMFLDAAGAFDPEKSQSGPLAAGVPGSVAGLLYALEKYGTRTRAQALAPAIGLAENGFAINERFAADLNELLRDAGKYSGTKKSFGKAHGVWNEGDTLIQPDLARTLRRIVERGREGFYAGETAEMLVREMEKDGGIIGREDLQAYRAIERPPVRGTYRGYELISMAPPSSGGVALIHILNLLEPFAVGAKGFNSSAGIALLAEAMKLAYADRAEFLGDPDQVPVPAPRLISKAYADIRRRLLDTLRATPSGRIGHGILPLREAEHTTHYSIVDQWGNAASVTTTLNGSFGCGIVVDGAGFLLNNEMDDFSAKPGTPNMFGVIGGTANAIAPHKRMLSSMTPTIVLRDGAPVLILGSPGGSTIITTVLQTIVNVIDHRMPLEEAVDAPRIHHQWRPDTLWYERRGLSADVVTNLRARGYTVLERDGYQGRVDAIAIDRAKGWYWGATDPRGYGEAAGY